MSKIAITYFEPFGGRTTNASKEVVSLLDGYQRIELPVSWLKVPPLIDEILKDEPDYLFMVGEAGNYDNIVIEAAAHNIANGKDNEGVTRNNELIIKDGQPEIINPILPKLFTIPYEFSLHAGQYLCNYAYYLALSKAQTTKVLFIHVPYIENNLNNLKDNLLHIIKSLTEE